MQMGDLFRECCADEEKWGNASEYLGQWVSVSVQHRMKDGMVDGFRKVYNTDLGKASPSSLELERCFLSYVLHNRWKDNGESNWNIRNTASRQSSQ